MLDLSYLGLANVGAVYRNLSTPRLYEEAIHRSEAQVGHLGPLVVSTGTFTDCSGDDRFIVREPSTQGEIWWGKVNRPFDPVDFDRVLEGLRSHLQDKELFVQDCYSGADPEYQIKVRIITELAWHSLFARNMFLQEHDREVLADFVPDYTVIHCPDFRVDPDQVHTHSGAFILLSFDRKLVVIGGTGYAGEIKMAIFTVMNYLLPHQGVLSLHGSANIGPRGAPVLFVGQSGTGKTTLATEADRALIGDDELGWSDRGVFNLEGGCHAKVIRLSDEAEPQIYRTTRRFGTILENVSLDSDTHRIDLHRGHTENTRGAYPITHLDHLAEGSMGGHPRHIFLLTVDAFGVLPPIAQLTPEQAMYHFISGYASEVVATSQGDSEPVATFSPCFGAPFMPLHPTVYASLLGKRIAEHHVTAWLVNTGWTDGPYGAGERFKIAESRAVIRAATSNELAGPSRYFVRDPVFKFCIPRKCRGIPNELLTPRPTWGDPGAYDAKAKELAHRFAENFQQFAEQAGPDVAAAGPVLD